MVCFLDISKIIKYFLFCSESNNLLEDLHIPDSRLIDGDAAELALIGKRSLNVIYMMLYSFSNRSKYIRGITQSC
jgi:hypothetical protein